MIVQQSKWCLFVSSFGARKWQSLGKKGWQVSHGKTALLPLIRAHQLYWSYVFKVPKIVEKTQKIRFYA